MSTMQQVDARETTHDETTDDQTTRDDTAASTAPVPVTRPLAPPQVPIARASVPAMGEE